MSLLRTVGGSSMHSFGRVSALYDRVGRCLDGSWAVHEPPLRVVRRDFRDRGARSLDGSWMVHGPLR